MRRLLPLLLAGCLGPVPIEDTPPTWERPPGANGDDDDDDTGTPGSVTVTPSAARAGAIVDVDVDLQNFAFDGTTGPCCAPPDLQLLGNGDGDGLSLRLFFGLELEGEVPWGMSGLTEAVETSFSVTGRPALTELVAPASAAVDLVEDGDFHLWSLEVPASNTLVAARVRDTGAPFFRPTLWWLAEDGYSTLAQGGFRIQGDTYDEPQAMFFGEPGSVRLRVGDANLQGGAGYTGTLEVATLAVDPPTSIPEVEFNDVYGSWQDLGGLAAGRHVLSGIASIAGHDEFNNPNGDLDVFVFGVQEDSTVSFRLDWTSVLEDFDAVVYDATNGEVALTFDSKDAIEPDMLAGRAQPEVGTLSLDAATPYVLMIANWQGSFDQDWVMTLDVMTNLWPDATQ